MTPRESRQVIDRMDAGRRAATLVLQRLDLGLDPAAIVRDLAPSLSPLAVQAAAQLAQLALFDFAALSLLLSGVVPDATLEDLEIPAAPPRPPRPSPSDLGIPEGDRP